MDKQIKDSKIRDKNILIISPERWGNMHLSKHHYAKTFAKNGNRVYFLNPPSQELPNTFSSTKISEPGELYSIEHRMLIPKIFRFKLRWFYDLLMKFKIKWLLKKIGRPIDVVWCFEPNLYAKPRLFGKKLFVYHPVDELYYDHQYKVGDDADIIFASAQEYLDKFGPTKAKRVFIDHGLANVFIEASKNIFSYPKKEAIRVGYCGNMLRPEIDIPIFQKIIDQHPDVIFEIWGSYQAKSTNLGGQESADTVQFIQFLQKRKNVILHGPIPPAQLALEIQNMDAFLICYDVIRDQSSGTNYHKIMEYLNTGKIIISNNVSTYKNHPEYIQMVKERTNNDLLPNLFAEVLNNLEVHNTKELQNQRIQYSNNYSYAHQVAKMEKLIAEHGLSSL